MVTPDPHNLYNVRTGEAEPLDKKENNEYHSITAQYLYLSKGARPDLQESVPFHCTRVKTVDKDDQNKLARAIQYLEETKHLQLILGMSVDRKIWWWDDASFVVHTDMKSRTDLCMSLGR